jgi:hypothetical protein
MVMNQPRKTTPYGTASPPALPSAPPPPSTSRATVLMRAPTLPPSAPVPRGPLPPPGQAPMPPSAQVPRAMAAPCRPSRPTPRVQTPPDPRKLQVHRRSEVMEALRAEVVRLRRGLGEER